MNQDIQEVLFTPEEIAAANQRLGQQIAHDYQGKNTFLV